jgi:tRNA A-37 threonylcarbamoyl transferase component Bud32
VATLAELMLEDLKEKYANLQIAAAYTRLYPDHGPSGRMFASFHQRLNELFSFMNIKAKSNRHYNAEESRSLIALFEEIEDARSILKRVGVNFEIAGDYMQVIEACKLFLSETYGSEIPEDFTKIVLMKYEPAFLLPETEIQLPDRWKNVKLKMVAEGAYAIVYKFTDPEYGTDFALKRAKRGLDEKDLVRFRKEFELLKSLRFPYVLEVYRYSSERNEYTMEYCDATLNDYIASNNARLHFGVRKRVALQFLYGLNYLHSKGHLHRDISYRNVLVKRYEGVAVVVKLSDFGLLKEHESELTRTGSELRGTILDPTIRSFKDYSVLNEIYSVGFLLSFIFSGRKDIAACSGPVRAIVDQCVTHDHAARYQDVRSIIHDIEALAPTTSERKTETPA